MTWLASLKTGNVNIPTVENESYNYEEIQIFTITVPNGDVETDGGKYAALIQKYIPYQLVVFIEDDSHFVMSTTDKRINQNDSSKRTIEQYYTTPATSKLYKTDVTKAFFKALDFKGFDKTNLETTYKAYIQAIVQLQTSGLTGSFERRTHKRTEEDMADLAKIEGLQQEIISLKSQLNKESQLNGKVQMNVIIQNKKKEIKKIKNKLSEA